MAKIEESLKRLSVENECKNNEINRKMMKRTELNLSLEETVSLEENYILSICGTQNDPEFRVGTALSDHTCAIYSVGESLTKIMTLTHNEAPIVGIQFSPASRNIFYTATNDGQIKACDLRAKGRVVAEFKDNTEDGKLKPLDSFDVSCDERLLAGGTEHVGGDAFILFWDARLSKRNGSKSSLLGGYWESHMDDVTCLAFHTAKPDVLASGSTDGLINVFDLKQPSEDTALTYSLNTESSVDKIGWLENENLWCTTHTHTLQLWDYEDATPYARFDRNSLAMSRSEDPDNCYLIRMHNSKVFGQPFLLAGSSNVKRENVWCLSVGKDRLDSLCDITENKQIVRDSWIHEKTGCLVTGGEGGIVNVWRQSELTTISSNRNDKFHIKINGGKARDKQHRSKPY